MANNDILYKDASATPQSFYPEADDLGNNIRRSKFGSADGAQVTLGAKADPVATGVSSATPGSWSLISVMKAILAFFFDTRATAQPLAAATLGATYAVSVNGQGSIGFNVSGLTASGATLTLEYTNDSSATPPAASWQTLNTMINGLLTPTLTADGNYGVNASTHAQVRLRVSAVGTGTITVGSNLSAQGTRVSITSPVSIASGQSISDIQSASYGGILNTLTPGSNGAFGAAVAAGRGFRVLCTAAGNISVTYVDGSTDTYPVAVGRSVFPEQIVSVAIPTSGGATATFANLK